MIAAYKLRVIQALQIEKSDRYLDDCLLDEAIKGNGTVTVPEAAVTATQRMHLELGDFNVEYNKDIHEYKISYTK